MLQCPICFEKINNHFIILNCQCHNSYHSKCITKWLNKKNTCPTCRKRWQNNPFSNCQQNKQLIENINHRIWLESIGINSNNYTIQFEEFL